MFSHQCHNSFTCSHHLPSFASISASLLVPSGKLTVCYGKSPFLMGKSTISTAIFNSKLSNYQRVKFHLTFRPLNHTIPHPILSSLPGVGRPAESIATALSISPAGSHLWGGLKTYRYPLVNVYKKHQTTMENHHV